MQAKFVRHTDNPLDSLKIGRVDERNIEKVHEVMEDLYTSYGNASLNTYWSTDLEIKMDHQFTMGFYSESNNDYRMTYNLENKLFSVTVKSKDGTSYRYDVSLEEAVDTLKKIAQLKK